MQTLCNPVPNGGINTAAGNNDRSDWATVTPYNADPDESRATDWRQVAWAHDTTNFFVRYLTFRTAAGGFLTYQEKLFLDTDQARTTGYHGNFLPIGADYFIEGASLYRFVGSAPDQWSWQYVTTLRYDDWPLNDQELTLPRAAIGSPAAVNFFLLAEPSDGLDYYPDSAPAPSGGHFTYSLTQPQLTLRIEGAPPDFYWITGAGPDGTYVLEGSANLRSWSVIATNETVSGEFLCVPPADGAPVKFFRAVRY